MTDALLAWFDRHKRPLPWRSEADRSDPYKVLVAEVMLQQTRVDVVVSYYLRWVRLFPSFAALAMAAEQDVLKAWEGLGYYRRARALRAAASMVEAEFGGCLPHEPAELRRLPGVGRYTAAAVRSLAFGEALIAVDGNVRRVAARVTASETEVSDAEAERLLAHLAVGPRGSEVAEALIELGALVCTPKRPSCAACPLRPSCAAGATENPAFVPTRRAARQVPLRKRVALVALEHQPTARVYLERRPENGLLGGLWGFPQVDASDARWQSSARGATGRGPAGGPAGTLDPEGPVIKAVRHAYSHFRLELVPLRVPVSVIEDAAPHAVPVAIDEVDRLPLSAVDRMVLERLRAAGALRPAGERYRAS